MCLRTPEKPPSGGARLRIRVSHIRNVIWAFCMREARVCPRTTKKRIVFFGSDLASAGKLDPLTSKDAKNGRATVASSLTPAELSRAQERARIWFEDHPAKP